MIYLTDVIIFWMVASRLSGFLVLAPGILDIEIPAQIKALLVAWIASFMTPLVAASSPITPHMTELVFALVGEFFCGLGLGLVTRMVMTMVQIGGRLIDNELAFTSAQQLNPQSDISGGVLGRIQLMLGLGIFWASDYFSTLMIGVEKSFQILPIGRFTVTVQSLDLLSRLGSEIFVAGVVMAAPITILSFVVTMGLGFLSRAVPHLNIFGESFTLRVFIGSAGLLVFLPLFLSMTSYFLARIIPMASDYFQALQ